MKVVTRVKRKVARTATKRATKKVVTRRVPTRVVVVDKKGKIVRGTIVIDIDKDGKPDKVTFYRRRRSMYAANVSLSSQKKKRGRKKK